MIGGLACCLEPVSRGPSQNRETEGRKIELGTTQVSGFNFMHFLVLPGEFSRIFFLGTEYLGMCIVV